MLTFSIWTYTPDYQKIEDSQVDPITVGKKKEPHEVFKPYRILSHEKGSFLGTTATSAVDNVMEALVDLEATELRYIQSNLSEAKINNMIHADNQMTLFFSAEVPVNTFRSVLQFTQNELPEVTFSHLLIDWSSLHQANVLQLSFISEEEQTLYTTDIAISEEKFNATFIKAIQKSIPYKEIARQDQLSLYVPANPVDLVQYTYFIDEISPETFKDALFKDANIVQKNIESNTSTKYTDGMASLTSDSGSKTIKYVYPASESIIEIKPSDLVEDSYEFINEHGGITGDYRYSYSNVPRHITEYQLFLQGLPVFSSITSTRIAVTWGGNQIFEYKRPYYMFGVSESSTHQLPSGVEIVQTLQNLKDIDELVLGYYLTQDPLKPVYSLEPSWFAIRDGNWARLTTDSLGGAQHGLE